MKGLDIMFYGRESISLRVARQARHRVFLAREERCNLPDVACCSCVSQLCPQSWCVSRTPGAGHLAWPQAPPRWFRRRRLEQSELRESSGEQQQGHARRTPEEHKERCRETLRPRGPAKDRGGKNRFHHRSFSGHAEKGRRDRKIS